MNDSDALAFARALVRVYEAAGLDGIADEMSYRQLDLRAEVWQEYEDAKRLIAEHPDG